jgi:hypothetical protein
MLSPQIRRQNTLVDPNALREMQPDAVDSGFQRETAMTTYTFGNGPGENFTSAGNIDDDTITFGNGAGDYVTTFDIIDGTITFGNDDGDFVTALLFAVSTISFGNCDGDHVIGVGPFGTEIDSDSTIGFGNGDNGYVACGVLAATISFGNGSDDYVTPRTSWTAISASATEPATTYPPAPSTAAAARSSLATGTVT